MSLYGKAKENCSNNLLVSKPSIELNEIAEAISQTQIFSNINSPTNSQNKIQEKNEDIENYLESTADNLTNLTNNSSCSKKSKVAPNFKNLDLKYSKKNSDGNFSASYKGEN